MATKNKQAKTSLIDNIFRADNPAKGMIIFAIAFAIVGGGYMAYRSFAASATTQIVAGYQKITAIQQPAKVVFENTASKKNAVVWQVGPQGSIVANITMPPISTGAPFSICASIRATQPGVVGVSFGNSIHGGGATYNVTASRSYKEYCTSLEFLQIYANSYNPGIVNSTGNTISVGHIMLQYNTQNTCYVSGSYVSGIYASGTTVTCNPYGSYTSYVSI